MTSIDMTGIGMTSIGMIARRSQAPRRLTACGPGGGMPEGVETVNRSETET